MCVFQKPFITNMRGYGAILQSSFILVNLLQFRTAHMISFPEQSFKSTIINSNSEINSSIRRYVLKSDLENNTSCRNSTTLLPSLNKTTSGESHAQMNTYRNTVKKLPHKESWNKVHQNSRILLNDRRETEDGRFDQDSPKRTISSVSLHQRIIQSLQMPSGKHQFRGGQRTSLSRANNSLHFKRK